MDKDTITLLVGAATAIVVAIIGRVPVENFMAAVKRKRTGIPELVHTRWDCTWNFEDGSLCVNDHVTFTRWIKSNQFEGYGEVTHRGKEHRYNIVGEVSRNRAVVLTYKAEKYPTEGNIGTVVLELSLDAENLDGLWCGLVAVKQTDTKYTTHLRGGHVTMAKLQDLKR